VPRIDTRSYWRDSASLPRFPTPSRNLNVDVVVVGGGITGITAAFLLKRAGCTVALIERDRCASIDTANTTAHLTCVTDTPLKELVKSFGEDHARAAWDAGFAAIATIDELVRAEAIDCQFSWTPAYQHAPAFREPTDDDVTELQREAELAARLGFDARFVERVPYFDRPGIEFADQARFHPRRYLAELIAALRGDTIRLGVAEPGSMILVTDPEDGNFFAGQMPIRPRSSSRRRTRLRCPRVAGVSLPAVRQGAGGLARIS